MPKQNDEHLLNCFRIGLEAGKNPFLATSQAWDCFELGRYWKDKGFAPDAVIGVKKTRGDRYILDLKPGDGRVIVYTIKYKPFSITIG